MENQQPEALALAEWCEENSPSIYRQSAETAKELRRLHARVQELEAMLEAVGAGGVSEQRVTQADARDAELVAAVVYASAEAMNSSMESPSFDGTIILESHHAASLSLALDELEQHRAAITKATGRADSGDGEKKGTP